MAPVIPSAGNALPSDVGMTGSIIPFKYFSNVTSVKPTLMIPFKTAAFPVPQCPISLTLLYIFHYLLTHLLWFILLIE